jgi:hypothetical protein
MAEIKRRQQELRNWAEQNLKTEDDGDTVKSSEQDSEYDNGPKYGDVDKTPITPQERQQFIKFLIGMTNDYFDMAKDALSDIGQDEDMMEPDIN